MEEAPSQVAEEGGRSGSGEWGAGVGSNLSLPPAGGSCPAGITAPAPPSGRGLPPPSTAPWLPTCILPGCHASSSRSVPGAPGTYTRRTRGPTLSWSVSAELSSKRCLAEKAMSSSMWAARSHQTEGEGKGEGATCTTWGWKRLLLLWASVD